MLHKVVLASGNAGKIREIQRLLEPLAISIIPQQDLSIPTIPETGLSFVENAILKARNACHHSQLPSIADDSGLEVACLNNQPGIYSARYAGENATDAENNQRLLQALQPYPEAQRIATYQCVLVFMRHERDPAPVIAAGQWQGVITDNPRGTHGFGYDPLFYLPSQQCTAAELDPDIKNTISHRGQALRSLLTQVKTISPFAEAAP